MTKRTFHIAIITASALLVATCAPRGMRMMGDAMIDAGMMLSDAGGDGAAAQDMGGSAATPSVPASENPAQYVGGVASGGGADVDVGTGPFYLTDLRTNDFSVATATIGTSCGGTSEFAVYASTSPDGALAGGRILVPAGQHLCIDVGSSLSAKVRWAGFRPY